jgi:hypothetical protein
MKKLFVVLITIVFASCSQDQNESVAPVAEASLSVLNGKLLSFKDDASFIKEYSVLSELKSTKEIKSWISKKGHTSFLNSSDASEGIQDSIIDNTRVIYSDALKAIVNEESKFKISGKVIWLNERNLYILTEKDQDKNLLELKSVKNDLDVYGSIFSLSNSKQKNKDNLANRWVVPNENRVMTYVNNGPNDKRYILDLFNETIVINNETVSTKMFLRSTMQYKSCSFWRCTYKNDNSTSRSMQISVAHNWVNELGNVFNGVFYTGGFSGTFTLLLANANSSLQVPSFPINFSISGNVRTIGFNGYVWNQPVSWY